MKINDKNLINYSKSHENIDKEGYLLKKGENGRSFQRRWFVLKGNLLFYFEKPRDQEPLGVIILEGCTTELADSSEHYLFKIIFQSCVSRAYELAAESQESLELWMLSIARASYDYLKLLVSELQKNLEEAQDKENASKRGLFVAPVAFMTPAMRNKRTNPFNNSNERSYSEMWDYSSTPGCRSSLLESCSSRERNCGVNDVIPPSIPFRTAPPPPTVRDRRVVRNVNKNSFNFLHTQYGNHIKEEKRLQTSDGSDAMSQPLSGVEVKNAAIVNLIGL